MNVTPALPPLRILTFFTAPSASMLMGMTRLRESVPTREDVRKQPLATHTLTRVSQYSEISANIILYRFCRNNLLPFIKKSNDAKTLKQQFL